jgi:hypothetical protein
MSLSIIVIKFEEAPVEMVCRSDDEVDLSRFMTPAPVPRPDGVQRCGVWTLDGARHKSQERSIDEMFFSCCKPFSDWMSAVI